MLRFKNRQKENQVDSLTAEFTVFRNEIDVYPFLIAIDRYKAVVGGRHNLDMSFDYNISLVESPLPFRASVEVSGNLDDMKFRLARAKYPRLLPSGGTLRGEKTSNRNCATSSSVRSWPTWRTKKNNPDLCT